MGNVTLPTPVFFAGGALCLLAGYFIGDVTGSGGVTQTVGTVISYKSTGSQLCLSGDAAASAEGAKDGTLCGRWRRSDAGAEVPSKGDNFRFFSIRTSADGESQTVIYGNVVS
ncbi:MAG: hypothetical protein V9E81_15675 [Marmoricola sp.]